MTQEERQLLLKDLCSRLPYGVKISYWKPGNGHNAYVRSIGALKMIDARDDSIWLTMQEGPYFYTDCIETSKPYLRPMSSMTEEENSELGELITIYDIVDWMLAHHFDVHNLIEKGLALEAPEGMYKTE